MLQIRAVFSKRGWREEEKGGGPAMESQGTGAGEVRGRRGAREKREKGGGREGAREGARGSDSR